VSLVTVGTNDGRPSLAIVEPVFANICVLKRMNRFMLRSKLKVDVQWRLFALVHNIGKIHVFGALA
jgi:hypothetical protein